MVISGDEGGPSSLEEDVLVYDEEELPLSCGFTGKFKFRNCGIVIVYLYIWYERSWWERSQ